MIEKPNLNYVNNLSGDDDNVKKLLIDVIKTEFPEEKKEYYESYHNKEYKKIEENVHRLKHKISILGLVKSYEIANEYEHNLRVKSTDKSDDFDIILLVITEYLKTFLLETQIYIYLHTSPSMKKLDPPNANLIQCTLQHIQSTCAAFLDNPE